MNILMKSALTAPQLRSRCDDTGHCPPLEVYLGSEADLKTDAGLVVAEKFLAANPMLPYRHLSDWLHIFHLPVARPFNLEALAFDAGQRALVLGYVDHLRAHGFCHIRLLTHVHSRPDVLRDLGLQQLFLAGLQPFISEDVTLYIEPTQIITVDEDDVQVFMAWDDTVFRYRAWLQEVLPALQLCTVVDVCHFMNSHAVLQQLAVTHTPTLEAFLAFLARNRRFGPDHFHLAAGRDVRQGAAHHGCGFESAEEQAFLRGFLAYLQQQHFSGSIVLETNETDPCRPVRMHQLRRQIMSILHG